MNKAISLFTGFLTVSLLLGAVGCVHVKPWQRGNIEREDMKWDTDPLRTSLREHVYFGVEGSSGGLKR